MVFERIPPKDRNPVITPVPLGTDGVDATKGRIVPHNQHGGAARFICNDILTLPFTSAPYVETDTDGLLTVGADYVEFDKAVGPGPYTGKNRTVAADYGASAFKNNDVRIRCRYTASSFTPVGVGGMGNWIHFNNGTLWSAPYVFCTFDYSIAGDRLRNIFSSDNFTQAIIDITPRPTVPFTYYYELWMKPATGLEIYQYDDANFSNLINSATAGWNSPMDFSHFFPFHEQNAWGAADGATFGLYDFEMAECELVY